MDRERRQAPQARRFGDGDDGEHGARRRHQNHSSRARQILRSTSPRGKVQPHRRWVVRRDAHETDSAPPKPTASLRWCRRCSPAGAAAAGGQHADADADAGAGVAEGERPCRTAASSGADFISARAELATTATNATVLTTLRRHEPAVNPERSNATGQPPQEEINPAVNLAQA